MVDLLTQVDRLRVRAGCQRDDRQRTELGQFLTPAPVARLMAGMLSGSHGRVTILDPGAGTGSLFAAAVTQLCSLPCRPTEIHVTAVEIDPSLGRYLREAMELCERWCARHGVRFEAELIEADFLEVAANRLSWLPSSYSVAIVNPPYRKMHSRSAYRALSRSLGLETSNLYAAFVAACCRLLQRKGELVAITPRSFCSGPYFRSFRALLLDAMSLERIHVFRSREAAFADDRVLQENIIFRAVKGGAQGEVVISSSEGVPRTTPPSWRVSFSQVVRPSDSQQVIHLPIDDAGRDAADAMAQFPATLDDLGLSVSTGRVVPFRCAVHLRDVPGPCTVPLIYPLHLRGGRVEWPRLPARKPNALVICADTAPLVVPNGAYVLVRRLSSKEERRRVVAVAYDPTAAPGDWVAFENHLNYFHRANRPLDPDLAIGLAAYLNSPLVDGYIRLFNGHTQVNATDLRAIRYPTEAVLRDVGRRAPEQPLWRNPSAAKVEL